jgi:hypothetical protein
MTLFLIVTNPASLPPAARPTFSPAAGAYAGTQTVTISTATPGATINYTLDGSTPTTSSPVYSTPLTVSASETINAIANAAGYEQSLVGSAPYVINGTVATPVFSEPSGSYVGSVRFTITCTTPGSSIYYTEDGSTPTYPPTGTTQLYDFADINDGAEGVLTFKAIAIAPAYIQSALASVLNH